MWTEGSDEPIRHHGAWTSDVRDHIFEVADEKWIGYSVFTVRPDCVVACPAMPRQKEAYPHRDNNCWMPPFSAMVARPVKRDEVKTNAESYQEERQS